MGLALAQEQSVCRGLLSLSVLIIWFLHRVVWGSGTPEVALGPKGSFLAWLRTGPLLCNFLFVEASPRLPGDGEGT